MKLVYFILIVNALLVFKLWWDKRAKDSGRVINHSLSLAINMVLCTVAGWFLLGWDAGGWLVIAGGYWWIVFDLLWNLADKNKWDYCGENSAFDRAADHLDGDPDNQRCNFYIVIKLLLIVGGILIIKYLQ